MRTESPRYVTPSRGRRRARPAYLTAAIGAAAMLAVVLLVGLVFAGSPSELAAGTTIGGVDVGGLTKRQAVAKLEAQSSALSAETVTFTAGGTSFSFAANQLAVDPDWAGAVEGASRVGEGFGPLRGFRRIRARVFGSEIQPRLAVSNGALEYALDRMAETVDSSAREAALARSGLRFVVVAGQPGVRLRRDDAGELIVRTLGSLDRPAGPTALPVAVVTPRVTAQELAPAARRARVAVSRPVFLKTDARSWRISRRRMATLLDLPRDGGSRLAIAGPAADAYFRFLAGRVGRAPVDAGFDVSGDAVSVVPAKDGLELNVVATARALLRAATRPTNRTAQLVVVRAQPAITTEGATAMGIDTRMAGYKTFYSGTPDRITNLQLGVRAFDGTLVEPGGTFSLNEAIGERTEERGFRPAPVIIGNEFAEEVGGGTSQVATTVFNAAWEAGLKITERHPHSLYISRYQLGRDATVYWPSLDLKFANDTESWILVKGLVEPDGIHVVIYGGDRRRVESTAKPLVVAGAAPRKYVKDPALAKGKRVVEEEGSRPTRTSATRTIYLPNGELLRTETWSTSYKGETRIIRIGTKEPKPKPEKDAKPEAKSPTPPAEGTTPSPAPPTP